MLFSNHSSPEILILFFHLYCCVIVVNFYVTMKRNEITSISSQSAHWILFQSLNDESIVRLVSIGSKLAVKCAPFTDPFIPTVKNRFSGCKVRVFEIKTLRT